MEVHLHCQVKHPIELIPGSPLSNGQIYRCSLLENEEISVKFMSSSERATFNLATHLVGVQLCWCRRRMGHGDFVLIIDP
jgi:hypothetical protein